MARAALLAALLWLGACQTPVPRAPAAANGAAPALDLPARYRERHAAGATVYRVDPAASDVRIYVFRGGRAAGLGHNHVLSAPTFDGYVSLDGEAAHTAQFDLRFAFEDLSIDDPALRAATGGSFAGVRSEADIAGTRRNMLGERVLDVARHPDLRVHSLAVEGDWPMLVARIAVDWRGKRREYDVLVHVERDGEALRARGELVLRQTDFGIRPLAVLGGVIAVQDAVGVRFDLRAARWSGP
ncbi:YceI family protein [Sinimarinibacterium thermocellulolyticum]|uniref:YceI family protein n=1 Tax=Sinimarinibacterium thermocellulolyticum TaxID=3170016 RepID=A0ABV2A601_9GAMM